MELPAYEGTYTNESKAGDNAVINSILKWLGSNQHQFRSYFVGSCYYCNVLSHEDIPLQRCSGCHLVGYCSRVCQKQDWITHKSVCKEFRVIEGKNVLQTEVSWKKHINELSEQADRFPAAKPIFLNPRVCNFCREARPDRLKDCICNCVSYCSKGCSNSDRLHRKNCSPLLCIAWENYFLNQSFTQEVEQKTSSECYMEIIQYVRQESPFDRYDLTPGSVCSTYTPLLNYTSLISPHKLVHELGHTGCENCESKHEIEVQRMAKLCNNRIAMFLLSYPISILYALQSLPERRLGLDHRPLEDLTTLSVHVVTSSPLLHSEPWEVFMHQLPKLKNLNIVFVIQKNQRKSFNLNLLVKSNLLRCEDCKVKNRTITYTVIQKHYHMFFSSLDYNSPDAVVVYENEYEMPCTDGDVNSEISYSNMVHSNSTVLIIMDATKDKVINGVKEVNAVQPILQLVRPRENPMRGVGANRAKMGAKDSFYDVNHYFACLKRK